MVSLTNIANCLSGQRSDIKTVVCELCNFAMTLMNILKLGLDPTRNLFPKTLVDVVGIRRQITSSIVL